MLGPKYFVADAIGNVHQLRSIERHAASFGNVKISVVLGDHRIDRHRFPQFLRRLCASGNYRVGVNRRSPGGQEN
jgi:hypothetical protein